MDLHRKVDAMSRFSVTIEVRPFALMYTQMNLAQFQNDWPIASPACKQKTQASEPVKQEAVIEWVYVRHDTSKDNVYR